MTSPAGPVVRFRDFELDISQYELRRHGRRVKLGRQPMDLLILLLQRPGQLVSRAEIAERLWGADVFVDVETGVNTAISKVRQALHDTAERAEYVETVAGRGYRFIAPIEAAPAPASPAPADPPEPTGPAPLSPPRQAIPSGREIGARAWRRPLVGLGLIGVVAVVIGLGLWWRAGPAAGVGGGSPTRPASIAVLPFANQAHDAEQDYLALGLTDEVTASLAQIDPGHLVVKGRTAGYRGSTKTALEIGHELGVDYLLEGAMLAEQGHVRVTATLIRVRDQEHVWSQGIERELTSALALQQDVSGAITAQVRARVSPDAADVAVNRQTAVPQAYDAYLRGRYLQSRRTPDGNRQAVVAYRRAIALDPNYALAWASLAFTYAGSVINADARPADVAPLAREAAERALRANPDLADAQFVAGYVNWVFDWDWPAAEHRLRRAIALDPGAAGHHRVLGHILSQMGRARDADAAMAQAYELDALDPLTPALWSQVDFQGRDVAGAIRHARQAILLDSTFWIGHMQLAQGYAQNGQSDLALAALTDAMRLSGGNSKAISLRGYVLARMGRTAEARAVLDLLAARGKERYVPPYASALVAAGMGDAGSAFAWLDKAYAERDVHLIYLPVDAKWDPYRTDPRFQALLVRCAFTSAPSPPR